MGSCFSVSHRMSRSSHGARAASLSPRMESTVRRMIWGVRALRAMPRQAKPMASANLGQTPRRYRAISAAFSRGESLVFGSMKQYPPYKTKEIFGKAQKKRSPSCKKTESAQKNAVLLLSAACVRRAPSVHASFRPMRTRPCFLWSSCAPPSGRVLFDNGLSISVFPFLVKRLFSEILGRTTKIDKARRAVL